MPRKNLERQNFYVYFGDEKTDSEPFSALPEAPHLLAEPDSQPPSPGSPPAGSCGRAEGGVTGSWCDRHFPILRFLIRL